MWLKTIPKSLNRDNNNNNINSNQNNKEKRIEKKKKTHNQLPSKSKHKKQCFLRSQQSVSFPPLWATAYFHFPRSLSGTEECWSVNLLWGQLRLYSCPNFVCTCFQHPQLPELECYLLWEHSLSFCIFHRHRVYLVDHVDLICILCSWWIRSLVLPPLELNCCFIPTSACGSSLGIHTQGCPGGFGLPQWGPFVEVVWLFGSWGPQWRQVHREVNGHGCRKHGSIRSLF